MEVWFHHQLIFLNIIVFLPYMKYIEHSTILVIFVGYDNRWTCGDAQQVASTIWQQNDLHVRNKTRQFDMCIHGYVNWYVNHKLCLKDDLLVKAMIWNPWQWRLLPSVKIPRFSQTPGSPMKGMRSFYWGFVPWKAQGCLGPIHMCCGTSLTWYLFGEFNVCVLDLTAPNYYT